MRAPGQSRGHDPPETFRKTVQRRRNPSWPRETARRKTKSRKDDCGICGIDRMKISGDSRSGRFRPVPSGCSQKDRARCGSITALEQSRQSCQSRNRLFFCCRSCCWSPSLATSNRQAIARHWPASRAHFAGTRLLRMPTLGGAYSARMAESGSTRAARRAGM